MSTIVNSEITLKFLTDDVYDFIGSYERERLTEIIQRYDVKRDTMDRDLEAHEELQTAVGWLLMVATDAQIQAKSDLGRTYSRLQEKYGIQLDSFTSSGSVKPASADRMRRVIEGDEDFIVAREDFERRDMFMRYVTDLKFGLRDRVVIAQEMGKRESARS